MSKRNTVAGKIVIVTGASAGIGEAAARQFARAGATVVLAARRAHRLDQMVEEIEAAGGKAVSTPTDLTDPEQITRLVKSTVEQFGRIDVLLNIAGWGRYDWFGELTAENLRKQYEVNVLGLAELTRQVVQVMQKQRSGHIINLSSYASRVSVPPLTVYASTKYAIEGLSDGLRRELMPWGIRVSRVHPSGVKGTEFNQQAARAGGVPFTPLPLGKVQREQVARSLLELVERPKREVFLSRLYDAGVFMNRHFPWLVDAVMGNYSGYRQRQKIENAQPDPQTNGQAGVSQPKRSPYGLPPYPLTPKTWVFTGMALGAWVAGKVLRNWSKK